MSWFDGDKCSFQVWNSGTIRTRRWTLGNEEDAWKADVRSRSTIGSHQGYRPGPLRCQTDAARRRFAWCIQPIVWRSTRRIGECFQHGCSMEGLDRLESDAICNVLAHTD